MPAITDDMVPQPDRAIVSREVDGEIYLASADGERMYTLSEVGAEIWRACDGTRSVGRIVDQLLEMYDVGQETLQQDVAEFLALLSDRGLVRWK